MRNGLVYLLVLAIMIFFGWNFVSTIDIQSQRLGVLETVRGSLDKQNVVIRDMAFWPAEIRVRAGDRLVFINQDKVQHKVISAVFESLPMNYGDKFVYDTVKKGEINYTDPDHPQMKGKLIVE